MLTRDLLVDVLRQPQDGLAHLDHDEACRIADACIRVLEAEVTEIRREILRNAAERISPESPAEQCFGGAPWDMGFHDGKAVAADALRMMSQNL